MGVNLYRYTGTNTVVLPTRMITSNRTPVNTRRNDNVIMTSQRRFDVILTLFLRRVSAGAT